MRKFLLTVAAVGGLALACPTHATACHKPVKANHTHHTVQASMKPFHRLGRGAKALGQKTVNFGASVAGFSFMAFDTAVIDPLGVALQAFADGVDMFIAAPLESLPEPFEAVGDGVHYVYAAIDKAGQVLAR